MAQARCGWVMLIVAAVLLLASCGSGSPQVGSAETASIPPSVDPDASSTTVPTEASGEFDVIVSAVGSAGLIGSLGVENLVVDHHAATAEPWLTFDLVMNYMAADSNTVVFGPGDHQWSAPVGTPPQLRIDGPVCAGTVTCADGERRVALTPQTPVGFQVFRGGDGLSPVAPGTLTVELTALFDYEHPGLDDETLPITLRFDVTETAPPATGATTPLATGAARVTTIGGGFGMLRYPFVGVADDPQQLTTILAPSSEPVDVGGLSIDWAQHAVIVLSIPTDACPPVLADLEITDGTARPIFVNPGYLGCVEPLLSHTIVATVARSVLADVHQLELPARDLFFEDAVTADVDISPPGEAHVIERPEVDFGETIGAAPLPARGEAAVATLDDGSPVFVVHHHDGTVSALDPRAPTDEPGHFMVVGWAAATRHFLGGGAWDEFGRRLDGFRATDLEGFATRVVDDTVQVGKRVDPPAGSPIAESTDPPAMTGSRIEPTELLDVDRALALQVGQSSWVDGSVVVDPDGAHLCHIVGASGAIPVDPCPPGSPTVDDLASTPGSRTVWYGPLLVTRTANGFSRVVAMGGYAGAAL